MAITFIQKRKSQNFLVLIFAVLILTIFFVLWFSGFFKKTENLLGEQPISAVPAKKIKINFDFLENNLIKDFTTYEDLPSFPATTDIGREVPFFLYK